MLLIWLQSCRHSLMVGGCVPAVWSVCMGAWEHVEIVLSSWMRTRVTTQGFVLCVLFIGLAHKKLAFIMDQPGFFSSSSVHTWRVLQIRVRRYPNKLDWKLDSGDTLRFAKLSFEPESNFIEQLKLANLFNAVAGLSAKMLLMFWTGLSARWTGRFVILIHYLIDCRVLAD